MRTRTHASEHIDTQIDIETVTDIIIDPHTHTHTHTHTRTYKHTHTHTHTHTH